MASKLRTSQTWLKFWNEVMTDLYGASHNKQAPSEVIRRRMEKYYIKERSKPLRSQLPVDFKEESI